MLLVLDGLSWMVWRRARGLMARSLIAPLFSMSWRTPSAHHLLIVLATQGRRRTFSGQGGEAVIWELCNAMNKELRVNIAGRIERVTAYTLDSPGRLLDAGSQHGRGSVCIPANGAMIPGGGKHTRTTKWVMRPPCGSWLGLGAAEPYDPDPTRTNCPCGEF